MPTNALKNFLLLKYLQGPDHPSKLRFVGWLGQHFFPVDGIPKTVYPDCRLLLHPRDYIERLLLSGIAYEPLTLEFLKSNLKAGDSAVFAGVNFGLHVITAAKAVGKTGRIIGVEPQPAALLRAEANFRLNGVSDIVDLVNVGLGQEETFVKMVWSDVHDNSGSASLLKEGKGFVIRLVPLASIITDLSPVPPRLLLLDVEGYEIHVLQGLTVATAPPLIIIEVQREIMKEAQVTEEQLLQKLESFGYKLFTLHGGPVHGPGQVIIENNLVGVRENTPVTWLPLRS